MNYILEGYLSFIQEREWDEEDDPGTGIEDRELLRKVVSQLDGSGDLAQKRQKHQPSLVNLFLKHALGDYRGRANTLNTYRFKRAGIKDWESAKKILKKAIDFERKIHPEKFLKNIRTVQNITREPLGRELMTDPGYSDGGDGGDGGGDGGL